MLGSTRSDAPAERVKVFETPGEKQIRHVLSMDPVWAAYAIADLQPAFAPHNRWLITQMQRGVGLVQVFDKLSPPVLFTMGESKVVGEALVRLYRPESIYATLREEHLPIVSKFYDLTQNQHFMWRMALADPDVSLPKRNPPHGWRLVALGPGDSERIRKLYSHGGAYTPDAFEDYQLQDGVYFGMEAANGVLLSVGGTHIVDRRFGLAAIGNMYSHPARRGIGLASVVLAAIVEKLLEDGYKNIVLNVDQRNEAAIKLYEKHGFDTYCPYFEAVGKRK